MGDSDQHPRDMDMLYEILAIPNPPGYRRLQDYIRQTLDRHGISHVSDVHGNVMSMPRKRVEHPICLCCHTDSVFVDTGHPVSTVKAENCLIAWDVAIRRQVGLGADDKVGVYMALQSAIDDNAACLFCADEEIDEHVKDAKTGADKLDMEWLKGIGCLVALDKGGSRAVVTWEKCRLGSDRDHVHMASPLFEAALMFVGKPYGRQKLDGTCSDAGTLKARGLEVSCCNLSVGYFWPHSNAAECVDLYAARQAEMYVSDLCRELPGTRWVHTGRDK